MAEECKKWKISLLLLFFFLGAVSQLIGCTSPVPVSTEMIPVELVLNQHHPYSLKVNVEGGGVEETLWISNVEFKKALEQSVLHSKVFSTIVDGEEADYQLDVFIGDIKLPMFGDAKTLLEVVWNLSKRGSGKTVWQEIVSTSFTTTGADSVIGAKRARMSAEGTARVNIEKGIHLLSQLSL